MLNLLQLRYTAAAQAIQMLNKETLMTKNLLVTCLFLLLPFSLFAETPEEKGLTIAEEADLRDQGWVDNNKSTELLWKEYSFQTGLSDRDFNKNALQRTR